MQNNWKYMILIIFSASLLLLLVRFARTQSGDFKTKKDIENLRKGKDSLFVIADQIVDSVEEDKRIKECQIDSLKEKLASQKQIIKAKTTYDNHEYVEKNVVMAAGVDTRVMEQELNRKQEIIETLTKVNQSLNREIDSLKSIIDKK